MFHRVFSDKHSSITTNSEGDVNPIPASVFVDRIFANDKVAKFDSEGELRFGRVSINRKTHEARIEWEHGFDENLEKNSYGHVILTSKIGVFDRKTVGFGTKVTNGFKTGTVREKRFFATAALEDNPNLVLDNICLEDLKRPGNWKKDDKIVYNNEWLGLVVDTRAKVYFTMDKDGKTGCVKDDNYGKRFPHPGEKIHRISLTYLWDAEWEQSNWFWNLLKYLANSAVIQRSEVDCMTIAWMGRIDDISNKSNSGPRPQPPPNILRSDAVGRVEYLYGRNWKYVKEHEVWEYEVKKGDSLITRNEWVKKVSEDTFFGLSDKSIDMDIVGQQPIEIDAADKAARIALEPGTRIYLKVIVWQSVVDVDWDNGTSETLPIFKVKPYYDTLNIIPVDEELIAGDVVKDKREDIETVKYGYIFNISINGVVKLKWITPNPHGNQPTVSPFCYVSKFDICLKKDYLYLRCFHNLPIVVPANGKRSVDGVRVGIAVGIDIAETKVIVRCPDQVERLVWAHDIKHYKWDIIHDIYENKWATWVEHETEVYYTGDRNKCDPVVLSLTPSSNDDESTRPPFRHIDIWPEDNYFAIEEFLPRFDDAKFQCILEKELKFFKEDLPQGIWVEVYRCRADLLTIVIKGPVGTPYEDHLLLFDFQLLYDFPSSSPDIFFHSYGLNINPCLGIEGNVTMPVVFKEEIEANSAGVQRSALLETVLHIRDHILIEEPYYLTQSYKINRKEDQSGEYKKFVILNVLEQTESTLKNPPKTWELFIQKYYSEALPRIITRHEQALAEHDNIRGDDPATPGESAFSLGLKSRLDKLRTFLPAPPTSSS